MKLNSSDGQSKMGLHKLSENEELVQCVFGDFSPFPEKIFSGAIIQISASDSAKVNRVIINHVMKQRSRDKQTRYQSSKIQ